MRSDGMNRGDKQPQPRPAWARQLRREMKPLTTWRDLAGLMVDVQRAGRGVRIDCRPNSDTSPAVKSSNKVVPVPPRA